MIYDNMLMGKSSMISHIMYIISKHQPPERNRHASLRSGIFLAGRYGVWARVGNLGDLHGISSEFPNDPCTSDQAYQNFNCALQLIDN